MKDALAFANNIKPLLLHAIPALYRGFHRSNAKTSGPKVIDYSQICQPSSRKTLP